MAREKVLTELWNRLLNDVNARNAICVE